MKTNRTSSESDNACIWNVVYLHMYNDIGDLQKQTVDIKHAFKLSYVHIFLFISAKIDMEQGIVLKFCLDCTKSLQNTVKICERSESILSLTHIKIV